MPRKLRKSKELVQISFPQPKIDIAQPGVWSATCRVQLSKQFQEAKVCIKTSSEIVAYAQENPELYKQLLEDILGLFQRFAEDLVRQKTPNVKESSSFARDMYKDFKESCEEAGNEAKQEHVPSPTPLENYYFLLVHPNPTEDRQDREFVAGYILSEKFDEFVYIQHVFCEAEKANLGSALVRVVMYNAFQCGCKYAILNFNPAKTFLKILYEKLGFQEVTSIRGSSGGPGKRSFKNEKGEPLLDKVHKMPMIRALNDEDTHVVVGLNLIPTRAPNVLSGLYCLDLPLSLGLPTGGDSSSAYLVNM